MQEVAFKAHHINATADDFCENDEIGRYIILPGSNGRAKEIAGYFEDLRIKQHERGHDLYLGTISCDGKKIGVATISTGMGCPSTEIILHELFHLGAKRFLRLGTAGTLQHDFVKKGDIVNATAAVRDEDTTTHYVPIEAPAIASLEFTSAILLAAESLELSSRLHTGIVHCKSSLYAREFCVGPRAFENQAYLNLLTQYGVLATEMETSALFVQSHLYNYQLMQKKQQKVLAGAILTVITGEAGFNEHLESDLDDSIELALETIKTLAIQELIS